MLKVVASTACRSGLALSEPTAPASAREAVSALTATSGGRWTATMDGTVHFIPINGQKVSKSGPSAVLAMATTALDTIFVLRFDGTIERLDAVGTSIAVQQLGRVTGRPCGLTALRDGRELVATAFDGTILIWSEAYGSRTYRPLDRITTQAAAMSGERVVISDGSRVLLVDLDGLVTDLAPIGEHVVALAVDEARGQIAVAGKSGSLYLVTQSGAVNIWPCRMSAWPVRLVWSATGERLAVASSDRTLRMFTRSGRELGLVTTEIAPLCPITRDGTDLLIARQGGSVRTIDFDHCVPEPLNGHDASVWALAFAPDGSEFYSAGGDGAIYGWETQSGIAFRTFHTEGGWANSVAVSADGTLLCSGHSDGNVRIWDRQNADLSQTLSGHTGWVNSVAANADGSIVASASSDLTVRVWDTTRGRCIAVLHDHDAWVNSVAIDPAGEIIASGSSDGTVRLWWWRTDDSALVVERRAHAITSITLRMIDDVLTGLSAGYDGHVRRWTLDAVSAVTEHRERVWVVAGSANLDVIALTGADRELEIRSGDDILRLPLQDVGTSCAVHSSQNEIVVVSAVRNGALQVYRIAC